MKRLALGLLLLAVLGAAFASGCAPLPAEPTPPAPPPAATVTPPVVSPSPRPAAPSAAAPDTTPSPAALAVLASIPEPIPLTESAAPERGRRTPPKAPGVSVPVPAEASDTLRSTPELPPSARSNDATVTDAAIPVPAPTRALGQEAPLPPAAAPIAPPPAPSAATPPSAPPPAVAEAAADTCWRLQVGAPAERAKASRLRDAAESQLLTRMVVEHEGGLWKVRSKDCVNRAAAESLKARALSTGFKGVFLVRYGSRTR